MEIEMKRLSNTAMLPQRSSASAAGYDLFACMDKPVSIHPGETVFIGTGIAAAIPEGYFGGVAARSGLSCKHGLAPANKLGIIDSDYRGEIKVALHNHSSEEHTVCPNDRIAQLVIIPYLAYSIKSVEELPETDRNSNGFGSTGV